MENIIKLFIEGPLANILVVSGILFLLLSVLGKIGTKIVLDPRKQKGAGIIGVMLLLTGLSLHLMALAISTKNESPEHLQVTNSHINPDDNFNEQISDIDIQIEDFEKELAHIPQSPESLHELQSIKQGQERALEEIENSRRVLRMEVEQLHLRANEDLGVRRMIEKLEGETIPDLENKSRGVQMQLEELNTLVHNAEKRDELRGRINDLKAQKKSLQKK
jgi:hypothetical protein